MKKQFWLIISWMFLPFIGSSQEYSDFKTVEGNTYNYYINQDWDSVLYAGKQALRNDIDYFYLRIRMGIAAFNKGKYFVASRHLNKAYKFNSSDTTTLEYLFYTYENIKRPLYQHFIAGKLNTSMKKRMLLNNGFYNNNLYIEGAYQFDQKIKVNAQEIKGPADIYGEYDYPVSYMYFGLMYKRYFKGIALNVAYNYLPSQRIKKIAIRPNMLSNEYTVSEHHFYINTEFSVKNKLTIIPAAQYQYINFTNISATWNETDFTYSFPNKTYTYNNYLVSLGLYKDAGRISMGLNGVFSHLYQNKIFQGSFLFTWFPFGNMKLYSTTGISWMAYFDKQNKGKNQTSQQPENREVSHAVFEETIGGQITKKLWLEGMIVFNGIKNYSRANAYVVYNTPEKINYLTGFSLIYEALPKLQLTISYQFLQKEVSLLQYYDNQNYIYKFNKNNSQTILGGLQWKL